MIGWLPSINAALNTISTVLLVTGLVFILRGNVRMHRACMMAALAVSVLFLISYLTYHAKVGHTVFNPGIPVVRTIYLVILWTHIPLAGLVPIFALRLLYLASKQRFKQHAALARWVFPVWMYVSVTGVVIYLMLYHLYPAR